MQESSSPLTSPRHCSPQRGVMWGSSGVGSEARLHANGEVLRRLVPAADGLGIDKFSAQMAKVADQDVINKRSNARRTPSPQVAPKGLLPGELLVLDTFGPVAARSVVDGAHYEFEAVCASTGYGYEQSTRRTSKSGKSRTQIRHSLPRYSRTI
ncbi:hypothetical protein AB1Y20_022740 [Prymnesium parvum]|uniref:Peptidylprolyl isomerase n=1 Tax=Prymnesium parvum TaxID=97485 RepID=A0AB34JJN9_PRYPA